MGIRPDHEDQVQIRVGGSEFTGETHDDPLNAGTPSRAQRVGDVEVHELRPAGSPRRGYRGGPGLEPTPDPIEILTSDVRARTSCAPGDDPRTHRHPDPDPGSGQPPPWPPAAPDPADQIGPDGSPGCFPRSREHCRSIAAVTVPEGGQDPVSAIEEPERRRTGTPGSTECMPDLRIGDDHCVPTEGPGSPGEIGVLVVREESRIEEPNLVEHRGTQQDSPAAEAVGWIIRYSSVDRSTETAVDTLSEFIETGAQAVEEFDPVPTEFDRARTRRLELDLRRAVGRNSHTPVPCTGDGDHIAARACRDHDSGNTLDVAPNIERPRQIRLGAKPGRDDPPGHVDTIHLHPLQRHPGRSPEHHLGRRRFEHHLRSSGSCRRVGLERFDEGSEPVGPDDDVVVDQRHVVDSRPLA